MDQGTDFLECGELSNCPAPQCYMDFCRQKAQSEEVVQIVQSHRIRTSPFTVCFTVLQSNIPFTDMNAIAEILSPLAKNL